MRLYRITFNVGGWTYDQYDAFVVYAESRKEAVEIVKKKYPPGGMYVDFNNGYKVELVKLKKGIVLDSFRAG